MGVKLTVNRATTANAGRGRHDSEHPVELEAVANADAPVVGRVAVEGHPDPENEETACHPG